jgi:hypothetical protein
MFIAPLPLLQSVHSSIAFREEQHSELKMLNAPLEIYFLNLFIVPLHQLYVHVVNKRPLTELCAPLAICFQIANSIRWGCNSKGLLQHGGRRIF